MPVPHSPDFEAQRLYDSVDLVNRVGDRARHELCVMSLVALMAGEHHSDRPACACPVITAYAIKLNDALDDSTRQHLKPFAPRIIGTRDGYSEERARFIVAKILRDVVPRLLDTRHGDLASLIGALRLTADVEVPRDAARRLTATLRVATRSGTLPHGRSGDLRYLLRAYGRESHELVATAAVVMLANCARMSAERTDAQWFWNYATDLLDKTCDVGISGTHSAADIEKMSQQAAARLQASLLREKLTRRVTGPGRMFRTSAD
ncbi:MAG: hypothetical protein VW644_04515 [Alphaproteobacteria bacterium]|jgi:hypothetical protein